MHSRVDLSGFERFVSACMINSNKSPALAVGKFEKRSTIFKGEYNGCPVSCKSRCNNGS